MAIIGKIRKLSWLIVVIIGVALASFVLQDFWRKSGSGRGGNNVFAEIAGEAIAKQDFDVKVQEQDDLYKKQNQKENLTPKENFDNMTKAWEALERDIIMLKEYEELGLAIEHDNLPKASISPEELYDLIAGNFLHPYIMQSFADPATGQVNRQQIQAYLQKFDQLKQEEKIQWKKLEDAIKEDRIVTKYNTLIAQGYYMPQAFLKRSFDESNRTIQCKLTGVKYQTIDDTKITISEEDYKKYYDEHSYEYEVDLSCDIDYVIWEVLPSAADKKKVDDEIALTYVEFQKAELADIETVVNSRSDKVYDSTFMKKGTLPVQIDSILFNSPVGTTIAPYIDNNVYYMSRLVQEQMRPDSMKASHILIMYKGAPGLQEQANVTRTKEQAKALADSLLNVLNENPAIFGALALQKSEFPSAAQDTGDLKWFVDGDINMKIFYDSCLIMKTGEIKVIQSNLGYHVLFLTGKTEPMKKLKVATISREIKPGSKTFNDYFSQASTFSSESSTAEAFAANIAAKGLNKRNAQFVREMDFGLPGLETSREIIRWAFDEKTEKGMVSGQVFDAQGKYVVALLTDRRTKGIATLEQVKTYIEPLVKREKKAAQIIGEINTALGTSKDLYAIAAKFNSKVDTVNMLTFSSPNMPNYGPDPEVVGTIFTMKPNVLSSPIKGDMAVYLIQLDGITEAPANSNYAMMKSQITSYFYQRIQSDVFKALKNKTEIIDNRILYY